VETSTPGQQIADSLAIVRDSWTFTIVQSIILAAWIALNIVAWAHHWDPYPFILLNFALSFQTAYAAPIIMMSQNRLAAKDRLMADGQRQSPGGSEGDHASSRTAGDDRHPAEDAGAASRDYQRVCRYAE
jgi:uncharacterized membrane protein